MGKKKQKQTKPIIIIDNKTVSKKPKEKKTKTKTDIPEPIQETNIDDIFRNVKKTKKIQKQSKKDNKDDIKKQLEAKLEEQWKKQEKMMRKGISQDQGNRKDVHGLKIYSEKQLNIGKGGNTNLCPIDCQCCF